VIYAAVGDSASSDNLRIYPLSLFTPACWSLLCIEMRVETFPLPLALTRLSCNVRIIYA